MHQLFFWIFALVLLLIFTFFVIVWIVYYTNKNDHTITKSEIQVFENYAKSIDYKDIG